MTRKDFELIASTLNDYRAHCGGNTGDVDAIALAFAYTLKRTNAQFNRDKFLRACGVPNA